MIIHLHMNFDNTWNHEFWSYINTWILIIH